VLDTNTLVRFILFLMMFLHALFDSIPRNALAVLLASCGASGDFMNIHRDTLLTQTAVISDYHTNCRVMVSHHTKMFQYICIPMMLLAFTTLTRMYSPQCSHDDVTIYP
jgi:hypothetical protein